MAPVLRNKRPIAEPVDSASKRLKRGEKAKPQPTLKRKRLADEPVQKRQKINDILWSDDDEVPLAIVQKRLQDKRAAVDDRPSKRQKKDSVPLPQPKRKRLADEGGTKRLKARAVQGSDDEVPTLTVNKRAAVDDRPSKRLRTIEPNDPSTEDADALYLKQLRANRHRGDPADENADARRMREIYYDPSHPASFGSIVNLAAAAGVDEKAAASWLASQDAYTLHKKVVRKFHRARYMVHDIGVLFQCDLLDMQSHAAQNKGIRYLLTCIDCFTRRLWVEPLIDKRGVTVLAAMQKIFRVLLPSKVSFDLGKEFINHDVLGYLRKNNIKYYGTVDKAKSALVERVNRTLREKLNKIMTARGSREYLSYLPDLVFGYNLAKHSATGMAPLDIKSKDVPRVWNYLYAGDGRYARVRQTNRLKSDITGGDRVRLARDLELHEKASASFGWTPEVFTVSKVTNMDPLMFTVRDDHDEPITGRLYKQELQKINKPLDGGTYMIDKIVEVRGKGASKRLLVAWKGYSAHYNSWIREKDLSAI
jgi:hypothetical protein